MSEPTPTDDPAYAGDVSEDHNIAETEELPPVTDPSQIPSDEGDAGSAGVVNQ